MTVFNFNDEHIYKHALMHLGRYEMLDHYMHGKSDGLKHSLEPLVCEHIYTRSRDKMKAIDCPRGGGFSEAAEEYLEAELMLNIAIALDMPHDKIVLFKEYLDVRKQEYLDYRKIPNNKSAPSNDITRNDFGSDIKKEMEEIKAKIERITNPIPNYTYTAPAIK